ncbi:hypothetical protein [Candidatus Spongiihabitans sp.]|uniref:hypothetical protein n=1 Tax=Candidatus Spongiihabitans sp. TaxID=3101308 RepID=UPI003C6F5027
MKAIQFFSDDYLNQCKALSSTQIVRYLDDFRLINKPANKSQSKLISIKSESNLLEAFKTTTGLDGMPYQTRIKQIMRD